MPYILYRRVGSNNVVETTSEEKFINFSASFRQREYATLPAGIKRGSVLSADFATITNPNPQPTNRQKASEGLREFYEICEQWSLEYYKIAPNALARKGIRWINSYKMSFRHLWNTAVAETSTTEQNRLFGQIATMANSAVLGPLDITSPREFVRKIDDIKDIQTGTGDNPTRAYLYVTTNGTRLNFASMQSYGGFISSFDAITLFFES